MHACIHSFPGGFSGRGRGALRLRLQIPGKKLGPGRPPDVQVPSTEEGHGRPGPSAARSSHPSRGLLHGRVQAESRPGDRRACAPGYPDASGKGEATLPIPGGVPSTLPGLSPLLGRTRGRRRPYLAGTAATAASRLPNADERTRGRRFSRRSPALPDWLSAAAPRRPRAGSTKLTLWTPEVEDKNKNKNRAGGRGRGVVWGSGHAHSPALAAVKLAAVRLESSSPRGSIAVLLNSFFIF